MSAHRGEQGKLEGFAGCGSGNPHADTLNASATAVIVRELSAFPPGMSNMVADEPGLSWENVDWLGVIFEYGLHLAPHGSIRRMAG
jgi:hypothetical protein